MRKIITLAIYTLATSPLFANFLCCDPCPFEGCYVGASLGIAANMGETRTDTSVSYVVGGGEPVTMANTIKTDAYILEPWGELYAGYGFRCGSCFYLGARISVNFTNRKIKATSEKGLTDIPDGDDEFVITWSDDVTSRLNSVEGAFDLKLGLVFCENTMFFGLVGVGLNQTKISSITKSRFTADILLNDSNTVLRTRKSEFSPGLRLGFGMERLLRPCLGLHITYLYTWYRDQKITGSDDTFGSFNLRAPNGLTTQHRIRNRHQVLSVGLSYYF